MGKRITVEQIWDAIKKHKTTWSFEPAYAMPKRRYTSKCGTRDLQFLLTCSLSKSEHWVYWAGLKNGRSTRSGQFRAAPTLEKLLAIKEKYNLKWNPTTLVRTKTIPSGHNRRQAWMKCECGREAWVWLNLYVMGRSKCCVSCRTRKGRTKMDMYKHPLRKTWIGINRPVKKDKKTKAEVLFRGWEHFKSWSLENGWSEGAKLKKKYLSNMCDIPEILQPILGKEPLFKVDAVKKVLDYAFENKLMDMPTADRIYIRMDETLAKFFGPETLPRSTVDKMVEKALVKRLYPYSPENCYWDRTNVTSKAKNLVGVKPW